MGCAGVGFFGFAGLCRTGGLSRSSETSHASDWSDVDFSVRGAGMGRRLVAAAAFSCHALASDARKLLPVVRGTRALVTAYAVSRAPYARPHPFTQS